MKKVTCLLILILSVWGCRKPYNPPVISSPGSYLVVEGTVNSGADSTFITLSKTVSLSGKVTTNPSLRATVTVESDQNAVYPLTEAANGNYVSAGLNLDNAHQYRLRIKTADGKEYLSDLAAVKNTPPIDSVGFTAQNGSLQIYVNTHDHNNNTRYYRWDYQETWQFHAKYQSQLITNGSVIVPRTAAQDIFTCFSADTSSTIVLGSSAKLKQDVIYQNPITQIPLASEKVEAKYSILVKQYALTDGAYTFWQNLKTNTEQLGSIFDAEPSQINGNIHCTTNPAEPVIGYVSFSTVQQKRIFIMADQQLPFSQTNYPYNCTEMPYLFCQDLDCQNFVALFLLPPGSTIIPITAIPPPPLPPIGYEAAPVDCVDCTIRGTKKQPAFWK